MAKRSSHLNRFIKIVSYLTFHFIMFIGFLVLPQLEISGIFLLFYVLCWYIANYVFFSNRDPADFEGTNN
jgi:hypothetical protein